jgi:surfactin synthase thioesterase subunit
MPSHRTALYCLPYAGASSAALYASWRRAVPDWLDIRPVELPGRGRRIAEPPCHSMEALTRQLADEMRGCLAQRYVLFGHSLGAWLAFELAHALSASGAPGPELVFVSAANAPLRSEAGRAPYRRLISDADVVARMRELAGTPPELLDNAEMLALMLPAVRADFDLCGAYRYQAKPPLTCPLHVFGGHGDASTSPEGLSAWQGETAANCAVEMLDGGHFFINERRDDLLRSIVRRLAPASRIGAFNPGTALGGPDGRETGIR